MATGDHYCPECRMWNAHARTCPNGTMYNAPFQSTEIIGHVYATDMTDYDKIRQIIREEMLKMHVEYTMQQDFNIDANSFRAVIREELETALDSLRGAGIRNGKK